LKSARWGQRAYIRLPESKEVVGRVPSRGGLRRRYASLSLVSKLLDESVEQAFVQHLVEFKPFWKQTSGLGFQEQTLDRDVPFGNVRRHNEKGKAIDAPLNSTIGLFAWNHLLP
jgi:hypothetical protein